MSRIIANPEILAGKPIIKGTRISVELILQLFASGMSVDEILAGYPTLKREDIQAALEYTVKILRHKEPYAVANVV